MPDLIHVLNLNEVTILINRDVSMMKVVVLRDFWYIKLNCIGECRINCRDRVTIKSWFGCC